MNAQLNESGHECSLWLNTAVYDDLFIVDNAHRAKLAHPHLWRTADTNIWSIIPTFPTNSLSAMWVFLRKVVRVYPLKSFSRGKPTSHTFVEYVGYDREVNLIKYITQKNFDKWMVGPLDFCVIARLQRMVGGSEQISVSRKSLC